MTLASGTRAISASNQRSRRWPTTRRVSAPTARMTNSVATMAMVFCTHRPLNQPSDCGKVAAIRCDSGSTHGLLMSDSRTKTNLMTTQVSQIGSSVSRPVMKSFCTEARCGGWSGGMGLL